MGIAEIKKTASPSFYDGLENMKEVQMNTSSMSFKSINTFCICCKHSFYAIGRWNG
jgi:hypothetical protein